MPLLLRTISRHKWYKNPGLSWLKKGCLIADALSDLRTTDGELSVWHIEDDRSNLEDVITACAAAREKVDKLDYALFNLELLDQLAIEIRDVPGDTPCGNANHWHRDLLKLSANKLTKLAYLIMNRAETQRFTPRHIHSLIKAAAALGKIDRQKLKESLRSEL